MAIEFAIVFWIVFACFLGVILAILRFFESRSRTAEALSGVILGFGFFVTLVVFFGLVTEIGEKNLQKNYPPRIFSKSFGFSPTEDVKILESSARFFYSQDQSMTTMKFSAQPKTIEKILEVRNFVEIMPFEFRRMHHRELLPFADDPRMQFYRSESFASSCDPDDGNCHAFLVYDKRSGEAYFSW
jgi:hypothetical protein